MEYIVNSPNRNVCGKRDGEIITSQDIINAGGNEKQLLRLETIKEVTKATKATPAAKATPAIQQEEVPVFNSVNNEQGEEQWQE